MKRENVTNELQNILLDYKAKLNGWNKVVRLHKKDGSDFAILSKNIDGAAIDRTYLFDATEPYLTIYYRVGGTSSSDNLSIYHRDKNYHNTDYNVDEVFQAIENRKSKIKEIINNYEKQVSIANEYLDKADKLVKDINNMFDDENLKDDIGKSSLGYKLVEYIKSNIR